MDLPAGTLEELRALLGDDGVLDSEAARFTYEADVLTLERGRRDIVVLPRSSDDVAFSARFASRSCADAKRSARGHRDR